jgi:hypothetical protein
MNRTRTQGPPAMNALLMLLLAAAGLVPGASVQTNGKGVYR